MYLILGGCTTFLILLYFYKQPTLVETPKTNIEIIQELVKTMNKLMEDARVDKAKFSEYLNVNNINPLKLWSEVKQAHLELDFQTQLSLFGEEFSKIIADFLSSGFFF